SVRGRGRERGAKSIITREFWRTCERHFQALLISPLPGPLPHWLVLPQFTSWGRGGKRWAPSRFFTHSSSQSTECTPRNCFWKIDLPLFGRFCYLNDDSFGSGDDPNRPVWPADHVLRSHAGIDRA